MSRNKKLRGFAKNLRKNSTDAEDRLWNALRAKQFAGLKFRRQQIIGNYIVDFICVEKRLIIECDGSQHLDQKQKDQKRDGWLRQEGYRTLRFWDNQVLQDLDTILEIIFRACKDHPPPSPLPSREGEPKKITSKNESRLFEQINKME